MNIAKLTLECNTSKLVLSNMMKEECKLKLSLSDESNILRSFIMSFNDGLISISGLALGVLATTSNSGVLFKSIVAGIIAGMISMALGEVASVSAEKDSQQKVIVNERSSLNQGKSLNFIASLYQKKGLSEALSLDFAQEMLQEDPLRTIVQEKYGFDINDITNPYFAGIASFIAFPLGSLIPLIFIMIAPIKFKLLFTGISVIIALLIIGTIAAKVTKSSAISNIIRNLIIGAISMGITYLVGCIL